MALIKAGEQIDDPYRRVAAGDSLPEHGAVLVDLETWQTAREILLGRKDAVGVLLMSDQHPDVIADDINELQLVALEFPQFRDGRAYSYARILREHYRFGGEVRAVGEVLMEQLHYMLRTGFDAFEIAGSDPLERYRLAEKDFTVWYQPTGDGRATATQRRHRG